MTGPANSKQTQHGRMYDWRGEQFYSVTTILGALPKPALVPWASKLVAEGAVDAFQNGTLAQMVADDPQEAVRHLKGLPNAKREKAADAGSTIHRWIEARILGAEPPVVPIAVRPQLEQFQAFEAEYKPEWLAAEATVYNRAEQYAGTLDFIAKIDGRICLGDVKSSKGVWPEHALQLAAYRRGEFIGTPDLQEHPLPEAQFCAVLHLLPRSYRLIEVDTSDDAFYFFKVARELFRWQREVSKNVIRDSVLRPGEDRVAEAVAKFGDAA